MDGYLLCGTPRTGSTLLCSLLRDTGVAGRPESYFRVPGEELWAERWGLPLGSFDYRDYVRAAVAEGSTPNGVFAARVMWGTLDELVAKLGSSGSDLDLLTAAFGQLRFVHCWREDTVAQAVSWARAEQTQFWQHDDVPLPDRSPRFDFALIDDLVRTIGAHNAAWRAWFAKFGVQAHSVRYEDLTTDIAGVTRGILDFLELSPAAGHAFVPRHRRQADELNRDWYARYHALAGR
ncbi:LPS sulfotransferase NodH [Asanoa hainanensis]|uniref:Trehalose 2-sulfotransferase n=1 Tax=Asanoa hainanensis TaxID=560556 RepID=A0A239P8I9_9ACTN|nr:Stf0 family sulfotransferase [Asanoa hainanensis]SNT63361.1 LPS sulfotransferase NodH [Asanoa hainanensis]